MERRLEKRIAGRAQWARPPEAGWCRGVWEREVWAGGIGSRLTGGSRYLSTALPLASSHLLAPPFSSGSYLLHIHPLSRETGSVSLLTERAELAKSSLRLRVGVADRVWLWWSAKRARGSVRTTLSERCIVFYTPVKRIPGIVLASLGSRTRPPPRRESERRLQHCRPGGVGRCGSEQGGCGVVCLTGEGRSEKGRRKRLTS